MIGQAAKWLAALAVYALMNATLAASGEGAQSWTLESPSARLKAEIRLDGGLSYAVSLQGKPVVSASPIDLKVDGLGWIARGGRVVNASERQATETIDFPVPRKFRQIKLGYRELTLSFSNNHALVVRAYDEGVAYRWTSAQAGDIVVVDELAQFTFAEKAKAWFPEEESIFSHQ
jgi:alpha-glucosidase